MTSTRKQKAKERRSRQLEMLSDVEKVDIMLQYNVATIQMVMRSANVRHYLLFLIRQYLLLCMKEGRTTR